MKHFLFIQSAIVLAVICCGWSWHREANLRPTMPVLNNQPRIIRPTYDYPLAVSDNQLQQVLQKVRPKFSELPPKTNFVDHGLRLWGHKIRFSDDSLDGGAMLQLLIDDQRFSETWGAAVPSLLKHTESGIDVVVQEGRSTVSHVDHFLGTLAEIGVGLSQKVRTRDGVGTVADLLQHAIENFQLNQKEYEWTALAAALYAKNASPWYSPEGQRISFDEIAERMMRQDQPLGVCYGQHRLYSLTMMLRVDDAMINEDGKALLSRLTRTSVESYLQDMTRRFHLTQALEGYWDGNWPDESRGVPDPETDELSRRVLATGHALEWWAMAPETLHPPRETIVRAAQWLTRVVIEMDTRTVEKNYTFLTHAARALSLWRGKFPDEAYLQAKKSLNELSGITN